MSDTERKAFQWPTGRQYYAAIAANLIMLANGTIIGWFSPALPKLLAIDTPLKSGPLTSVQVSWVGGIANLGALCGSLTFGYFTAVLGCKKAMVFLAIPSILYWILIHFGDEYYLLLCARFFTGWTNGGIQSTILLYVSSIAENSIRGRLGSFMLLSRNSGILAAYIVGAFVEYEYIPSIFIIIPIIYLICFILLPNTPQYYIQKNNVEKAENSLKYYKSYKGSTEVEVSAFNDEFNRLQSVAKEHKTDQKLSISDFTNARAVKGLIIGMFLAYFAQFTGCMTVITYAVFILKKSGTTLNPYTSSIALAANLIIGNLCTAQCADKLGRKTFMIISLLGSAAGLIALSAYLYMCQIGFELQGYSWIPVASLAWLVFISSAGIIPLSHVCRVENLPTKIRAPGLAICIFMLNIFAFLCAKLFPILVDIIELHGCMMIFAFNCIIGSFFIYFVVDETNGKHMDQLKTEQPKTNDQSKA